MHTARNLRFTYLYIEPKYPGNIGKNVFATLHLLYSTLHFNDIYLQGKIC